MKGFSIFLAIVVFLVSSANADDKKEKERLENAGQVITEIMNIPDNIPQGLLDKARCVVVLPSVVKGAFIVGANYGRGVMICRGGANFDGPWGAPTMMALESNSEFRPSSWHRFPRKYPCLSGRQPQRHRHRVLLYWSERPWRSGHS